MPVHLLSVEAGIAGEREQQVTPGHAAEIFTPAQLAQLEAGLVVEAHGRQWVDVLAVARRAIADHQHRARFANVDEDEARRHPYLIDEARRP